LKSNGCLPSYRRLGGAWTSVLLALLENPLPATYYRAARRLIYALYQNAKLAGFILDPLLDVMRRGKAAHGLWQFHSPQER